jgi:hypothetical protein
LLSVDFLMSERTPTAFTLARSVLESDIADAATLGESELTLTARADAQRALADLLLARAVALRDVDEDESNALFEQAREVLSLAEAAVGVDGDEVVRLRSEAQRDGFEALVNQIQNEINQNENDNDNDYNDNDNDDNENDDVDVDDDVDDDGEEFDIFGKIHSK